MSENSVPGVDLKAAIKALQDAWVVSAELDGPSDHKVAVRMLIDDALKALNDHTPLPRPDQKDLTERARRGNGTRCDWHDGKNHQCETRTNLFLSGRPLCVEHALIVQKK